MFTYGPYLRRSRLDASFYKFDFTCSRERISIWISGGSAPQRRELYNIRRLFLPTVDIYGGVASFYTFDFTCSREYLVVLVFE